MRAFVPILFLCFSLQASEVQDISIRFATLSTISMFLAIPVFVAAQLGSVSKPSDQEVGPVVKEATLALIGCQISAWFLSALFQNRDNATPSALILMVFSFFSQILGLCVDGQVWSDLSGLYQKTQVNDNRFKWGILGSSIANAVTTIVSWAWLLRISWVYAHEQQRIWPTV